MKFLHIMIPSDSLPLYFKRTTAVFLICLLSYFISIGNNTNISYSDVKNSINTVIVDAGHGGKDPGAVGKNSKEKDIALKIALKLGKYIEDNIEGVKVVYTRKTDVFVPLHERANIANRNEADLYISIHVNANKKTAPMGTSSHILGLHRSEENLDVAIRENSVIMLEEDYETTYEGFDPESLESYIIFSVMQNTYLKQSIEFASYVQDQFRERANRKDRGVVQQGLLVLARSAMPGVLIETGFISNLQEEKYLMTDEGQDIIASAIYRAFKQYKTRIEDRSHFTVLPPEPEKEIEPLKEIVKTDEIYFRVQIASSKNRVSTTPSSFKGQTDVAIIEQGRWFKYTVGANLTYSQALNRCESVKNDFPGSFVIAVKNNEIVPLGEALIQINK